MRRNLVRCLLLASVVSLGACGSRSSTAPEGDVIVIDGSVRGTGNVIFLQIEGGFYAIRSDDGKTYDPLGGMPSAFRTHGLAVEFEGRVRGDVVSIHMVGEILELTQLRAR